MVKFGTGGWRAIIGEEFTKENIQKLTLAMCLKMKAEHKDTKSVVIGYDRRFLSKEAVIWGQPPRAQDCGGQSRCAEEAAVRQCRKEGCRDRGMCCASGVTRCLHLWLYFKGKRHHLPKRLCRGRERRRIEAGRGN